MLFLEETAIWIGSARIELLEWWFHKGWEPALVEATSFFEYNKRGQLIEYNVPENKALIGITNTHPRYGKLVRLLTRPADPSKGEIQLHNRWVVLLDKEELAL